MKAHRVWLAVSSLLLTSWAPSAIACDLAQSRIVFPNLGTHIAWYCKATDAEKRQAIDLALKASCVPAKLKELGKPPIAKEATDVIP